MPHMRAVHEARKEGASAKLRGRKLNQLTKTAAEEACDRSRFGSG